jgi:hypothetical protein
MMDDTEEDLYEWICDYMFNFPDATFEDVLDEFDGYGLTRDQIELAYEDIRSMYF